MLSVASNADLACPLLVKRVPASQLTAVNLLPHGPALAAFAHIVHSPGSVLFYCVTSAPRKQIDTSHEIFKTPYRGLGDTYNMYNQLKLIIVLVTFHLVNL